MLFILEGCQAVDKCFMEIELKKILTALFATASLLAAVSAAAADNQSTSGNLTVRASLTNGCGIVFNGDAETVDFGPITDLGASLSRERSFTIKCTNSLTTGGTQDNNTYTPTSVSLNAGDVAGSTVSDRLMANISNSTSKDTLQFQVYQGHQGSGNVWGDQASGGANGVYPTPSTTATYPFTVTLLSQSIAGKAVGIYSNTMVATVNYSAGAGS